jgi:hypothetical protein
MAKRDVEKRDNIKGIFDYSIGCIALIGVLATVIILFVTIKSPSVVIQFIERASNLSTSTPVIIQITSESKVSIDTPTDSPLQYPTYTPYPTYTIYPATVVTVFTPTLNIIDTQPGTILEVGQTWRQGGSELTLTEVVLHPARDDNYGQLYTAWKFKNISPNDIVLSFSHSNFAAQTNLGNSLKILKFYSESFWCDDVNIVVKSGEALDFSDMCGPGSSGYKLPIVVDLGNKQIIEVIVSASEISDIVGAKWKIPIFH